MIAALTVSLGAHWAFLQTVAWTGMLYTYSKQAGFAQAVSMTFDGEHPCSLCKAIQEGKAEERQEKKEAAQVSKDLKMGLPPLQFVFCHPPRGDLLCATHHLTSLWGHPPELPPPRDA